MLYSFNKRELVHIIAIATEYDGIKITDRKSNQNVQGGRERTS